MKNITSHSLYITIFLFLLLNTNLKAQLVIDGEIRPRVEFRNGYKQAPDSITIKNPNYQVNQRSRINLKYSNSNIKTKISLQDVRMWGDEKLKTDTAGINLYEAWAEFRICDSLYIKVGRQELVYDNERLFTNSNWSQKGITHDLFLLKYIRSGWNIDLGFGFNQAKDVNYGTSYSPTAFKGNYKTLNYLWVTKNINKNLKFSAVSIADGFEYSKNKDILYVRSTSGLIIDYKVNDKIKIATRDFYQLGKNSDSKDIEAFYLSLDFSYKFTPKFTTTIGAEVLSGNDATNKTDKKYRQFNTLYGSGHRFNGNIDYFTDFSKDTKGAGLNDFYINLNYKFTDNLSARLDLHHFQLQNKLVIWNSKGESPYLGDEADFSLQYQLNKETSIMAGYSFYLPSYTLQLIQLGSSKKALPGNWAFVMISVKPTFLK